MTKSSIKNYSPCWLCDKGVDTTKAYFCGEFDTFYCNDCAKPDICVVCESEGIRR